MKCPYCLDEIPNEAKKCRNCGEWVIESDNEEKKFILNTLLSIDERLKSLEDIIKPIDSSKINSIQEINPQVGDKLNPFELIKLKRGDYVFHSMLGKGKVVEIEIPENFEESLTQFRGKVQFSHREDPNELLLVFSKLRKFHPKN